MRLREHAIYLKLVSRRDGLNEGLFVETLDDLSSLGGGFDNYSDLSATRLPERRIVPDTAPPYADLVGVGFHPTARFAVTGPGPVRRVEFNGGLHPYSGVYVVQVDARIDASTAAENPRAVLRLARRAVELWDPLTLHVHDVDDDAIQNIDNPRLLQLGYGVDGPVDLEARPGREASRGQFRFAVNWVTYLGAEALTLLDAVEREDWPVPTERVGHGRWFQLASHPNEIGAERFRADQTALRAALDFDRLIDADRRSFSYWKRKP